MEDAFFLLIDSEHFGIDGCGGESGKGADIGVTSGEFEDIFDKGGDVILWRDGAIGGEADVAVATAVGGDDGKASESGFDKIDWKPFPFAGGNCEVGDLEEFRNVGAEAEEMDAIF